MHTQYRQDLAAALRLAEKFGFSEGICNHFSVQIDDSRFLLNPHGIHWSTITASDILEVGNESSSDAETTALFIHSAIHALHVDANCVMHTHMPNATALTCIESGRLQYIHQNSLRFYQDVAYDDDYSGLVESPEEGSRIAQLLDNKRVLFLANHGVIVTGSNIAEAFDRLYYLERACEIQILAMATGRNLREIGDNIAQQTRLEFDAGSNYAALHFDALKRLLQNDYLM